MILPTLESKLILFLSAIIHTHREVKCHRACFQCISVQKFQLYGKQYSSFHLTRDSSLFLETSTALKQNEAYGQRKGWIVHKLSRRFCCIQTI